MESILKFYKSVTTNESTFTNNTSSSSAILEDATIIENIVKDISLSFNDPINQNYLKSLLKKSKGNSRVGQNDSGKEEKAQK